MHGALRRRFGVNLICGTVEYRAFEKLDPYLTVPRNTIIPHA
jgi:hypothetical protein